MELTGIAGLLIFVIDIWAILRVVKSDAEDLQKAVWIGLIFFLPVLGLILWFLFGPSPD